MTSRSVQDKRVLVVGLAKSGVAAARLLAAKGAKVVGTDKRSAAELGETGKLLTDLGATLKLGAHDPDVFTDCDLMVVSPGVPLALPEIQRAKAKGVEVVGEVELASWYLPRTAKFIGITGTNGKSTTTALTGCLCETAGQKTFAGGNLGKPLAEAALMSTGRDAGATSRDAGATGDWAFIVCELSSFQLEGIATLQPDVAVVTNLTPDHIDRYADMAAYAAAKKRIFMNQSDAEFAVVNADDAGVMKMTEGIKSRVYTFGAGPVAANAARFDGGRILAMVGPSQELYELRNRALRGRHNAENAMASILAARLAGIPASEIQKGLDAYPGLAHRIEYAGTIGEVEYINDSKATNVDSSIVALKAFDKGVWLIAGGRGKGLPYAPMVEASQGRVKGVLTIGEDAQLIAAAYRGVCEVIPAGDLATALKLAHARAKPGDTVLLSPACASYDQFKNFEERGAIFKQLVKDLERAAT